MKVYFLPLSTVIIIAFSRILHAVEQYYDQNSEMVNCQQGGSERCACSLLDALKDIYINSIISKQNYRFGTSDNELETKIQSYECTQFKEIPNPLRPIFGVVGYNPNLGSNFVKSVSGSQAPGRFRNGPRRRRIKRQISLGVPNDHVFEEAIAELRPRALHQYVALGSIAKLTCFGPEDVVEHGSWEERKFTWYRNDGSPVTTAGMTTDQESGMLTINAAQFEDMDIYNCSVEYKDDSYATIDRKSFIHQLDIVSKPLFWLKSSLQYTAYSCNHENLLLIQDNLSSWVLKYICPFCEVSNSSVTCSQQAHIQEDYVDDDGLKEIVIRLAVTTVGMESRLLLSKLDCSLSCLESLHLKVLQILRNSLQKLFSVPIEIEVGVGTDSYKKLLYLPQSETLNVELMMGCLAGYFETYKLCFPCDRGEFSPNGNTDCYPCHKGSYQDHQGSSACIPCKDGLQTFSMRSVSTSDCINEYLVSTVNNIWKHVLLSVLIVLIILMTAGVIILLCCFPDTQVSAGLSYCLCCCGCCHTCADNCRRCSKRPHKTPSYRTLPQYGKNKNNDYDSFENDAQMSENEEDVAAILSNSVKGRKQSYENKVQELSTFKPFSDNNNNNNKSTRVKLRMGNPPIPNFKNEDLNTQGERNSLNPQEGYRSSRFNEKIQPRRNSPFHNEHTRRSNERVDNHKETREVVNYNYNNNNTLKPVHLHRCTPKPNSFQEMRSKIMYKNQPPPPPAPPMPDNLL